MTVEELLLKLNDNERRGSKARCHLLTHGSRPQVATRLTNLAEPWIEVGVDDHWMPEGFKAKCEAQLHQCAELLPEQVRTRLKTWWLASTKGSPRTPTWDIASTCRIDGRRGLLLIEAKAHDAELKPEGKEIASDASQDSRANHEKIQLAILEAKQGLTSTTGNEFGLSRDSHYQLANRFAWSWKIAQLGVPVVLVYLGFINADEMFDRGNPLRSDEHWTTLVKRHGESLIPQDVWNREHYVDGQIFVPLIVSMNQPLALPEEGAAR